MHEKVPSCNGMLNKVAANANMWLPQERKRLIAIGTKKPFKNLRYPNNKPVRVKIIIDIGTKVDTPDYVQKRLNGAYRDKPIVTWGRDCNEQYSDSYLYQKYIKGSS